MEKRELREILDLVKVKLERDVETACGLFWADDCATKYAVGECDDDPPCVTAYAVGECDSAGRYSVGE